MNYFRTMLACVIIAAVPGHAEEASQSAFQRIELYTTAKYAAPKEEPKEGTLTQNTGMRLYFKNVSATFSVGLPATKVQDTEAFSPSAFNENHLERYGAVAHLAESTFFYNVNIYLGTLLYGKAYSRLKSPTLSTFGPLTKKAVLAPGLYPHLPSYSSAEKPLSYALTLLPAGRTAAFPAIELALLSTGERFISIYKIGSLPHIQRMSLAFTAGEFVYGQKLTTSWFLKDRYFPTQAYRAYNVEYCVSTRFFRSSQVFGWYENPFGGFKDDFPWYASHTALTLPHVTLQTGYFSADPSIIGTGGKKLHVSRQMQANPQFSFGTNGVTIKHGLYIQKNEKESSAKEPVPYEEYTFKGKTSIQNKKVTFAVEGGKTLSTKNDSATYSGKASVQIRGAHARSTSSFGIKASDTKETYSFSQTLSPTQGIVSSLSLTGSLVFKENEFDSGKLSGSITVSHRTQWTTVTGKLGIATTF